MLTCILMMDNARFGRNPLLLEDTFEQGVKMVRNVTVGQIITLAAILNTFFWVLPYSVKCACTLMTYYYWQNIGIIITAKWIVWVRTGTGVCWKSSILLMMLWWVLYARVVQDLLITECCLHYLMMCQPLLLQHSIVLAQHSLPLLVSTSSVSSSSL